MHELRPTLSPPMDIDWLRHRTALNRSLLGVALVLAALGVASFVSQPAAELRFTFSPAALLFASAVWMLVAYLCGRLRREALSGWLVVLLVIAWLALGLVALPGYVLALLPTALLPIGLAALLLNRPSLLAVTALTLGVVLLLTTGILPPIPALLTELPISQIDLAIVTITTTGVLLALLLLPLRGANTTLGRELAQQHASQARLAQERRAIEQERDTALNTIARQRQYLDGLVERIRDGVIGVNAEGEVVRANQVARQFYTEATKNGTRPLLGQVETALVMPDSGTPRAELVPLPAFGLPADEVFTHMLIDRREQLRLVRLRGELLGLLTDEMLNPLTSMVTALDLTLGQENLPEEIDRVLIGARQSGQRLLELVTVLLEISQIEQNPDVLRRSTTSLARVIEAGIAQMAPLAQRGAVTVSVEHAGDSAIEVDGERVQRSFCYLLEQALRQSPPYSIVQVRTRRVDNQLVVQISDQGPGRTVQQSEQLFRQGGDERSASSLGLIYSKLVIEAHGGRVWAETNNGQGGSYSFALPLERQELVA